jgi:hypothetical protein
MPIWAPEESFGLDEAAGLAAITGENVVDAVKTWVANDVVINGAKVELSVGVDVSNI